MITTELRNIEGRLTSNAKMATGLRFMALLRDEGLLDVGTGIFPAICGGAVRDCLFTGNEINDIDIFFFRDTRSPSIDRNMSVEMSRGSGIAAELNNFRNNVLVWLEDQDIESESLLSQHAADYFGGQRFIDIIQFVWEETTIQLMIPTGDQLNSSLDYLMRTMPIYSGMAVTREYFRAFDTSIAHMWLPQGTYYIATDRDVPYLRHKTEGQANVRYLPVSSSREAVQMALHSFEATVNSLPEGHELDMTTLNLNSSSNLVKRALAARLDINPSVVAYDSRVIHTL